MSCSICGSANNIQCKFDQTELCADCVDTKEGKALLERSGSQSNRLDDSTIKPAIDTQSFTLTSLFYILAGLSLFGGVILCGLLWPGDPGFGNEWRTTAYIPAVTWLTAGIVQFALFTAIGRGLFYLAEIARNTLICTAPISKKQSKYSTSDKKGNASISDDGTEWTCSCGHVNSYDPNKEIQNCSSCKRNRDFVLNRA